MHDRFDDDATPEESAEVRRQRFDAQLARVMVAHARDASSPERIRERERMLAMDRERKRRERVLLAIERGAPIDPDVRCAAFDETEPTKPLSAVLHALAWRENRRRPCVLYLGGPPGTGKTVALTRLMLDAPHTGRYVQANAVPARNGFSMNEEEYKLLLRVDVLAIDELGRELKPDVIRDLILDRWTHGGMTVIAGNGTPDLFATRYLDDALRSRLHMQSKQGLSPFVRIDGADMRAA